MRQSLGAALAVLVVYGLGLVMWPEAAAQPVLALLALGLAALWILHVGAYIGRTIAKARRQDTQPALATDAIGRRRLLGVALRAASIGIVASVPVALLPSRALAYCGQCTKDDNCGGSANGWCCKNTAAVNSGKVCNECKAC